MNIGTQLIAPDGFESLVPNITYYLAHRDAIVDRVTLVWYGGKDQQCTYFVRLPSKKFESALLDKHLIEAERQSLMPPWLSDLEGTHPTEIELRRRKPKKTYQSIVERRFSFIQKLAEDPGQVFSSLDISKVIAVHAQACDPPQNPVRIATWFVAYHLSGNNIWALMPRYLHIGRWDRSTHPSREKKLGRPAISKGRSSGHSAIPLVDSIAEAYLRYARLGECMTSIYRTAMREVFGCKVVTDGKGKKSFYHPESKPFPTLGQFRYWVHKRFGSAEVRLALYGAARLRAQSIMSVGTFASSVSNILERCEVDAYSLKERPRNILSDSPAPPLVVARGLCLTTGGIAGVGFAFEKENADSYRGMLFSMALPKSVFCALFGLQISDEDWPCQGLPSHYITDRGPGAVDGLIAELSEKFPVRELAPSYSGQSKASIESSHPRDVAFEGAPTHVVSNLNVVEMMKREILRAIADNETSDISSRLTPQMVADGVAPNPHALWRYLEERGRTDARPMSLPDAVRTFLKPVSFFARADGVYLQGIRYDSKEFRDARLLERMAPGQSVPIKGYVLPLCVRTAWIECGGMLMQVQAMLSLRDDEGQLYLPLDELDIRAAELRRLNADQREHKLAAQAEAEQRFKEATGKSWDAGSRKGGKQPKTTVEAKREAKVAARRNVTQANR